MALGTLVLAADPFEVNVVDQVGRARIGRSGTAARHARRILERLTRCAWRGAFPWALRRCHVQGRVSRLSHQGHGTVACGLHVLGDLVIGEPAQKAGLTVDY